MKFAKLEYLPVSYLNPATYNPRSISDESFRQLKNSISAYGFVQVVVVQKDGYNIIGGHQGVRAIIDIYKEEKRRGVPRVPCAIVDLDERQAKLLNVALNKIRGDFDMPKLASLMKALDDENEILDEELSSIGFSWPELEDLVPTREDEGGEDVASDVDEQQEQSEFPGQRGYNLTVRFTDKAERDGVRAVLVARAAKQNVSLGEVLAKLLLPSS